MDKRDPKETINIFEKMVKASVKDNPKPKRNLKETNMEFLFKEGDRVKSNKGDHDYCMIVKSVERHKETMDIIVNCYWEEIGPSKYMEHHRNYRESELELC